MWASKVKRRDTKAKLINMAILAVTVLGLSAACRQDMHDQPRYRPYRESPFFEDGQSARPPVEGTVARGHLKDDPVFYTGKRDDTVVRTAQTGQPGGSQARPYADTFPFPITSEVLDRGQERFNISCAPCHGRVGNGDGMVVQRGFRRPPSYHIDRLRQAPPGYFFDVITNGFGAMPDYAAQVGPRDRWAIVAYIKALQLSQYATLSDVPSEERRKLEAEK